MTKAQVVHKPTIERLRKIKREMSRYESAYNLHGESQKYLILLDVVNLLDELIDIESSEATS